MNIPDNDNSMSWTMEETLEADETLAQLDAESMPVSERTQVLKERGEL